MKHLPAARGILANAIRGGLLGLTVIASHAWGASPGPSIRILPPKAENLASGLSERFVRVLGEGLVAWRIRPRDATRVRLATTLVQETEASLRLEAKVMPEIGDTSLFQKIYLAPVMLFDRMVQRRLHDLAKRLDGHPVSTTRKLLLVREFDQGISEILLTNAAGSRIERLTHHGSRTLLPASVRNGRFAYVTYVTGPPQIWGMDLEHRQPRRLYMSIGGRGVVSNPALSPDGRTVAFLESDKQGRQAIRLLDWETGATRTLTGFALGMSSPAWSPDGTRLAFACGTTRGERLVVLSKDGEVAKSFTFQDQEIRDPAWSPDGTRIGFAARTQSGISQLRTVELATDSVVVLCSSPEPLSSPRWDPKSPWIAYTVRGTETRLLNLENRASHPLLASLHAHHSPRWVW